MFLNIKSNHFKNNSFWQYMIDHNIKSNTTDKKFKRLIVLSKKHYCKKILSFFVNPNFSLESYIKVPFVKR